MEGRRRRSAVLHLLGKRKREGLESAEVERMRGFEFEALDDRRES
jgi:hypothetical protein